MKHSDQDTKDIMYALKVMAKKNGNGKPKRRDYDDSFYDNGRKPRWKEKRRPRTDKW